MNSIRIYRKNSFTNEFEKFVKHIEALDIGERFQKDCIDKSFIDSNPSIYLYYLYLFHKSFSVDCTDEIELLNTASFIYYKSIIYLDELLDNPQPDVRGMITVSILQEQSIKLLTSIFPIDSSFWKLWNKRRQEYLQAYHLDRHPELVRTVLDFEKLADYKSAFGKVAIDSVYILSGQINEQLYKVLLDSHKYYYIALQIMDDINDLREDVAHGQFNILKLRVEEELSNRGIDYHGCSAHQLVEYAYVLGVVSELLTQCVEYIDRAKEEIKPFDHLEDWHTELEVLNNQAVITQLNLNAHLKMTTVDIELASPHPSPKPLGGLAQATSYIEKWQEENGAWNEFYNHAGTSDSWATGYIVSMLGQQAIRDIFPNEMLNKGVHFLSQDQAHQWGYNRYWIPDADSSTFAMLALHLTDTPIPENAIEKWLTYQNKDGGMATYRDSDDVISSLNSEGSLDVSGWLSSHTCVSTVAYYFMCMMGYSGDERIRLESFLAHQVSVQGLWDAYWWTSPLYSTCYMIKCRPYASQQLLPLIDGAVLAIMALQNENGSFGNQYTRDSAYYTGMVVDALCEVDIYRRGHTAQIQHAVSWLRFSQLSDGSWHATSGMRMPDCVVSDPSSVPNWPIATTGLNIRAKEFGRLFSTVSALSGIAKYAKWYS